MVVNVWSCWIKAKNCCKGQKPNTAAKFLQRLQRLQIVEELTYIVAELQNCCKSL